jgi:hypothetical protein
MPVGVLMRGAGALGDLLPGVALVVGLRGARAAGAGAGLAVVVAGLGHAVALFHFGLGRLHVVAGHGGAGAQGEHGGEGEAGVLFIVRFMEGVSFVLV